MGVSHEDVEVVQQCVCPHPIIFDSVRLRFVVQIELVAAFTGVRLNKVPRVADIEHEV